jgi:hypothetical protein
LSSLLCGSALSWLFIAAAPAQQTPAKPDAARPAAPQATPAQPGALPPAPVQIQAPAGGAPVIVAEAQPRISDPQAVAIVDAYLKAIGGKENLSKIKDRTTKFSNLKHAATGDTEAEINLLIKDGICIREEWEIKGFQIKDEKLAFIQIYNGHQEEGWVHMLGTVSPLDGRTLQVFVWDKQMDDFFCHWQEDGYTLGLAGQGVVSKEHTDDKEDHPCDIVQVLDFSGRQAQKFFFSKKNNLLLKKEWQDTGTNPKAASNKEQYYRNYRDLVLRDDPSRSIKFALTLEIYMDGDLDTTRNYTNVQFNSGLSPKLFEKPEGRPFKGVEGPQGTPGAEAAKKSAEEDLPPWKRAKGTKGRKSAAVGETPAGAPEEKKAEAPAGTPPPAPAPPAEQPKS